MNLLISKLSLIILLLSSYIIAQAQYKYDYWWQFGHHSFSGDTRFGGTYFDFRERPAVIHPQNIEMNFVSAALSMCDKDGNFIFASNGCWIANADQMLMINGDSINTGIIRSSWCEGTFEAMPYPYDIIGLPLTDDSIKYYIIHGNIDIPREISAGVRLPLYKSVVEIKNNESRVLEKNIPIQTDTLSTLFVNACKHSDNKSWWIITHEYKTNKFYLQLIDSIGNIQAPLDQIIGDTLNHGGIGNGLFSPDGKKFAHFDGGYSPFSLYDFDRNTGRLSNYKKILVDSVMVGSISFSSNSRYLYLIMLHKIIQYDTYADDIQASAEVIAYYDGYLEDSIFQANFYQSQLAPDCKIYISSTASSKYLHVINYPDRKGTACDFIQRGVKLSRWNSGTMPYYPNYRLGTPYENQCDTLTSTSFMPIVRRGEAIVYPNPVRDKINIMYNPVGDESQKMEISIINMQGISVKKEAFDTHDYQWYVDVGEFPPGLYVLVISDRKGIRVMDKVVKQ